MWTHIYTRTIKNFLPHGASPRILGLLLAPPVSLLLNSFPLSTSRSFLPVVAAEPATPAKDDSTRLTSPDDQECPWCTEMSNGPCRSEFIAWRNCSQRVKREVEAEIANEGTTPSSTADPTVQQARTRPRYVTECMDLFKIMNACVKTPGPKRDYYMHLLPPDDDYKPKKEDIENDLSTDDL